MCGFYSGHPLFFIINTDTIMLKMFYSLVRVLICLAMNLNNEMKHTIDLQNVYNYNLIINTIIMLNSIIIYVCTSKTIIISSTILCSVVDFRFLYLVYLQTFHFRRSCAPTRSHYSLP